MGDLCTTCCERVLWTILSQTPDAMNGARFPAQLEQQQLTPLCGIEEDGADSLSRTDDLPHTKRLLYR